MSKKDKKFICFKSFPLTCRMYFWIPAQNISTKGRKIFSENPQKTKIKYLNKKNSMFIKNSCSHVQERFDQIAEIFNKTQKCFRLKSQKVEKSQKKFSSGGFYENLECSFDHAPKSFRRKTVNFRSMSENFWCNR